MTTLTPREQDVLRLIAAGSTDKEIAVALGISPDTAKVHAGAIYRKLGVTGRTEAAARFVREQVVRELAAPRPRKARTADERQLALELR